MSYTRAKMRPQVALYTGPAISPPALHANPALKMDHDTGPRSGPENAGGVSWPGATSGLALPVMTPLSKNDGPMSGVELPHFEAREATHQAAICALERTPSLSRIRST